MLTSIFYLDTHFNFRIGFIFTIAGKKGQINFSLSTKNKIVLVLVLVRGQ